MRSACLCLLLLACGTEPARPATCPRACTADDVGCTTFPYDELPERCLDICYLGACCELEHGVWQTTTVHCARPNIDAGVDAAAPAT